MDDHTVVLPNGTLRITVVRAQWALDELLAFAARANPRRPFLFVSKVLGRHLPCRPATLRATYADLAAPLLNAPGPIWIIGLAETAVGLGAGVGNELARLAARTDVFFQHTTRLPLSAPPLLTFAEVHSHAPTHLLHHPTPALAAAFAATRTLVLVDDELSTGRSLGELARALLPHLPQLERIALVALVNWLDDPARAAWAETLRQRAGRALEVLWVSLLDGRFAFVPAPGRAPVALPPDVTPRRAPHRVRADLGRRGLRLPVVSPWTDDHAPALPARPPLAVVGTGECAFAPYLLAETLEQAGYDVTMQCTTRSPVVLGAAIRASVSCPDPYGQGVGYYLHHPPPPERMVLAVYETPAGRDAPHPDWRWTRLAVPG